MPWFDQHIRVKWECWGCEHGKLEIARMGNVELQTAYYGRRPNYIRVYDKVAEWRKEYGIRPVNGSQDGYAIFSVTVSGILQKSQKYCKY